MSSEGGSGPLRHNSITVTLDSTCMPCQPYRRTPRRGSRRLWMACEHDGCRDAREHSARYHGPRRAGKTRFPYSKWSCGGRTRTDDLWVMSSTLPVPDRPRSCPAVLLAAPARPLWSLLVPSCPRTFVSIPVSIRGVEALPPGCSLAASSDIRDSSICRYAVIMAR
jgi:hypothetical protein